MGWALGLAIATTASGIAVMLYYARSPLRSRRLNVLAGCTITLLGFAILIGTVVPNEAVATMTQYLFVAGAMFSLVTEIRLGYRWAKADRVENQVAR